MGTTSETIDASARTLTIWRTLNERGEARVGELAEHLEMNVSTVHHHLATLADAGLVVQEGRRYRVSLRALAFGARTKRSLQVFRRGRPEIERLAEAHDVTAHVVVEEENRPVVVCQAGRVPERDIFAGQTVEYHSTAAGKAILAQYSPEEIRTRLAETELESRTENTITDLDELVAHVQEVADERIAFEDGERYEDLRGIAIPLRSERILMGVLSVVGRTESMPERVFKDELPTRMKNVAGEMLYDELYRPWIDDEW